VDNSGKMQGGSCVTRFSSLSPDTTKEDKGRKYAERLLLDKCPHGVCSAFFSSFVVLGMESRASCLLGRCSY
jgi:hypothetical protein